MMFPLCIQEINVDAIVKFKDLAPITTRIFKIVGIKVITRIKSNK